MHSIIIFKSAEWKWLAFELILFVFEYLWAIEGAHIEISQYNIQNKLSVAAIYWMLYAYFTA